MIVVSANDNLCRNNDQGQSPTVGWVKRLLAGFRRRAACGQSSRISYRAGDEAKPGIGRRLNPAYDVRKHYVLWHFPYLQTPIQQGQNASS